MKPLDFVFLGILIVYLYLAAWTRGIDLPQLQPGSASDWYIGLRR